MGSGSRARLYRMVEEFQGGERGEAGSNQKKVTVEGPISETDK
jgi:hypothetical protein